MEQLPRRGSGAVEDFDYVRFGGPTIASERHLTVTTAQRIIVNNPDRIMVIITNNGPDSLIWSLDGNPVALTAQQLGIGQQEVFQVQNDGALCSHEIWAIASPTTCVLSIIEVTRQHA